LKEVSQNGFLSDKRIDGWMEKAIEIEIEKEIEKEMEIGIERERRIVIEMETNMVIKRDRERDRAQRKRRIQCLEGIDRKWN
jgi:hypothetical protein